MRDPGLRSEHRAEIQVGLLVLLALVALVAGVMWVTGADLGGDRLRLFAMTPQAAQVSEGSRVYLHGVDVGSVEEVKLTRDGAVMALDVSGEVTLPADSRAVIRSAGFLGNQMVELVPGSADRRVAAGDTLSAGPSPSLQEMAQELGGQAETLLERSSRVLSDSTVRAVQSGAADLSATLAEVRGLVEEERETLSSLIASLERTSTNLAEATSGPHLERTLARIDSLTGTLERTSQGLDSSSRSLASILEKVDEGEGSLGKLVNDERLYERITAAAANLQTASEEIGLLSRDIRQRPERYLSGVDFSVF